MSHRVYGFVVGIVHCLGYTIPGESAVDFSGRDLDLEHERVADLGLGNVGSVRIADLHLTRRRRTSVGNRARRRNHGDIEALAEVDGTRGVDTPDPVGLGVEGHQLGMFLDHEDEASDALVVEQAASVELHDEVNGAAGLALLDGKAALGVVAVALDVHYSVEFGVGEHDVDLDAIRETVDDDFGSVEVLGRDDGGWDGDAAGVWVAGVALDTAADALVVDGRGVGVGAAGVGHAGILAGKARLFTILERRAVGIDSAFWFWKR